MTIKRTLKLDDEWDLALDANGGLAVLTSNEAVAQTIANRCRLFVRDASYAYNEGIQYFDLALGEVIPKDALISELRRIIEDVDGVDTVLSIEVSAFDADSRLVKAEIIVLTEDSVNVRISV